MLIQPESIRIIRSSGRPTQDDSMDGRVLVPPDYTVNILAGAGTFCFSCDGFSLEPCFDESEALKELLTAAVREMPGSGSAHYDAVNWRAYSHLSDGKSIVIRKDEFTIGSDLSVLAVCVPEVFLGPILAIELRIP